MRNELIIHSRESEAVIALLQDGKLTELHTESDDDRFSVGDIYIGRVRKLAKGLNAAFVDVGYEKDAFLHYHDLGPQVKSWHSFLKRTQTGKQHSNITNFKMESLIQKDGSVEEVLKPGQNVVVQIAKEPISTKGPRITSEISLAGRFIVLVPFTNRISVSQKIRDRKEKDRLRKLATSIQPKGFGIIVRTVAEDRTTAELEADLKDLLKKWRIMHRQLKKAKAPARALSELNRASAFLRDVFNDAYERIVVDDQELYNEIREYIESIAPERVEIVKYFDGKTPIFQHFGVDRQIKSSFGRSVSMTKGTYLIIEHTEAMHVIDVNSGNRSNQGESQEDNALAVNLIAAQEIARQLRLRDMGGIIVIDFIDMHKGENRKILHEKLREIMKSDRAKHKILPPSRFGLIEITRQRVRPEMNIPTREEDPDSLVEAPILIIDDIEHSIQRIAQDGIKKIFLHVHPFIHSYITKGIWSSLRKQWQRRHKVKLTVIPRDAYKTLEYKFFDKDDQQIELKKINRLDEKIERVLEDDPSSNDGSNHQEPKKKQPKKSSNRSNRNSSKNNSNEGDSQKSSSNKPAASEKSSDQQGSNSKSSNNRSSNQNRSNQNNSNQKNAGQRSSNRSNSSQKQDENKQESSKQGSAKRDQQQGQNKGQAQKQDQNQDQKADQNNDPKKDTNRGNSSGQQKRSSASNTSRSRRSKPKEDSNQQGQPEQKDQQKQDRPSSSNDKDPRTQQDQKKSQDQPKNDQEQGQKKEGPKRRPQKKEEPHSDKSNQQNEKKSDDPKGPAPQEKQEPSNQVSRKDDPNRPDQNEPKS